MKRASIISKQGKPELEKAVREAAQWLQQHGYSVSVDAVTREFWPEGEPAEREDLINQNPNFVLVLGGDGTLLSTARSVAR
ncbi:MAG TPA: NAD(+)/NADH kinase, partial [Terriglobales bacterium]|nr:NAD(+)/NADH kinase [Terriglobales bacterium]